MSLYSRNYGSWSSKGSTATAPAATSTLDRSSRYGSSSVGSSSSSGTSSSSGSKPAASATSSYRALPLTSVRDRAAQMETAPAEKPSIREKYASRTYGVDSSSLRKSPEPKSEAKGASSYKRYSSSYSPTTETPSLRFGSSSRFGGQIARSPITEKSPTVFGVSGYSRTSSREEEKPEPAGVTEMITLITRGTSPTPPSTSSFLRARRAEMDRTLEKTVPKLKPRHSTYSTECQTEEKCIEDAKLESKLSVASALTARTPSPASSTYSRYSTAYTPRTSAYHGSRPTELSLKSSTSSVLKTSSQDEVKPEPSPTKDEKIKKLEGKDTTRIGGFSYARPTDLPVALNKAMADSDGKTDGLVSPSKIRSTSPQTPSSPQRLKTRELSNLSSDQLSKPYKSSVSRANILGDSNDDTHTHSIKNETSTGSVSVASSAKVPLSSSRSSAKLTSPDRCKLPPPSPKSEISKTVPNKDFRKSELNMNLSSSNESLGSQKPKTVKIGEKNGLEPSTGRSPVKLTTSKSLVKLPSTSPSQKLSPSPNKVTSTLLSKTIKKEQSSESSSEDSTSSETSSSSDSESSESENEEPVQAKTNGITTTNAVSKISRTSSKTSAQMSSADESAIPIDKPPRPPSGVKLNKAPEDKRAEEAKAVVVRALAPVTGIMKVKYPGSSAEESSDKETKQSNKVTSPGLGKSSSKSSLGSKKNFKITHIESGERAWWMGPTNDGLDKKAEKSGSQTSLASKVDSEQTQKETVSVPPTPPKVEGNKSTSTSETETKPPIPQRQYKLKKADSGSSSDVPGLEKSPSTKSLRKDKSKTSLYKIRRIDSGEKPWWMQENEENTVASQEPPTDSVSNSHTEIAPEADKKAPQYPISKVESGERTSWLGDVDDSSKESQKTSSPKLISSSPNKMSQLAKTQSGDRSSWLGDSDESTKEKATSKKPYAISKIESGERAWWMSESDEPKKEPLPPQQSPTQPPKKPYAISKIESGERAWWLGDSDEPKKEPKPPVPVQKPAKRPKDLPLFIGRHTNIDDVLGTQAPPPAAFRTPQNSSDESDGESEEMFEVRADDVKIHDSTPMTSSISRPNGMIKLDDTALQLYKEGDYGSYLDLDASINEQQEEFENFQANRKNSIVLRTQLSVRVHTIIEKLMSSEGRELRRALFSLKQIFQEDKDLVHEFVQNDGLACLIKVGSDADQNYQNYILRALGQVMLYVDGMNGVMEHSPTVQWLYTLVASKFRLVVKTALKLLLVFVEYVETNSVLLVKAIQSVDSTQGNALWSNVMRLMKEYDAADTELLIYATSLINKTLNGLPDQDTYYDQVDALEEQGFENIIRRYMSKQGTDLDLLRQFQIYEAVLQHEDGEQKGAPLKQLDETIRKTLRHRKCLTTTLNPIERRKSRRHSTGTSPLHLTLNLSRAVDLDPDSQTDEYHNVPDDLSVTPALRRRRERADRQRSFLREQREATLRASLSSTDQSGSEDGGVRNGICNGDSNHARRENTVKDLTQKLASTLGSPVLDAEGKPVSRVGDMKGIISKAKEGLAKSQSRADVLKSPTTETPPPPLKPPEVKKSETELHWEELVSNCSRDLSLCDLDFTDLLSDDEQSVFAPTSCAPGIPPPPPPCGMPPPIPAPAAPPPLNNMVPSRLSSPVRKNKKTVKLFWKEVRDDPVVFARLNTNALIWDEISPVSVDTQKLEHLFESRAKDLITKEKQQEMNKNKEVIVLDPKRSNAINIGMTKLPPPRSIKTAILKMDATIMNREGIEKLLTMLPTEEECSKIQEAQAANPDLPLGSAEQFLLTLASISELPARLKLWAFKLDFENSEKEIAEPLMDLKQGVETLKSNNTFRGVLGTLLSIGIFLNGNEVKGFQIEYLAKVPEVKDTVHKHSLLHHLCHMVMEKFPESTDLYSEIGAVTRASKVDFDELSGNIVRLETECKASFDHLKVISKHDGSCNNMKVKMSDFLADCAEHIIVLGKVHRRVMNRYFKFCLWLGIPYHRVQATKPNELCRIVSEFALEYRTTRERVMQQLEKKASHRERNKTRGKMITEVGKFRSQDDRADAELRQLLGNDSADNETSLTGSLPWRRQRKDIGRVSLGNVRNDGTNGNLTDADDEILESLVKTATKIPSTRTAPRERKRTRHADLVKRSRTRDNVPGEGTESQS
ncbi:uncharacterized protein LOC124361680 isoform X4 [Homalodisca vitripennis]|uniref:uncharacterized protein LOC124361680 isoform X4 n=1 Tax=Homalodisca vitripennis TaxID=197043 RepID=UPI001EEBBE6A|nr:uncharacterized protein LOC124361680 isoform X4 [Homalodisca vitripennis]